MSMITSTAWVRRGVAAQFPERYEIDEAEISRISKLAKVQLESARTDLNAARNANANDDDNDEEEEDEDEDDVMETTDEVEVEKKEKKKSKPEDDDDLAEYDMEHYDSDPRDEEGDEVTMFGNVQSLAYHQPHEKDPYLVLPNRADGAGDDSDEDREDLQILPSDNLLLAGKVEDEVAHLEVYVYEDAADNLYVHHDVMLPAIPLCVEWLDIPVGNNARESGRSHGNFVAVGTMEPDIEVWDLDVVDCMYPSAILGKAPDDEVEGEKKSKKKTKKSLKKNEEYHVDAVLALAANRQHRNLLASASADCTVKLWDLNDANTTRCAKSYTHHTDKVCSLDWHAKESTVLLSGSYDRSVVACDMRSAEGQVGRWTVPSDVECVRWDPHDANILYITTDSGLVVCHDLRTPDTALWTLQAHDDSVSSFDVNAFIPGFLVTGSTDKTVKIWNVLDNKPSMVVSRKVEEVGKIFSTAFGPDRAVGFRLAVAGSKGVVKVWDTSTNGAVRRAFATKVASAEEMGVREGGAEGEGQGMVGVADDEEDDDDEME
ncbi:uncharacterized protein GIQ15_03313 [Arthroderma uncinatum]|uniref:uncharacterized protein n=1 Tax=Arthroderma uncinatum TaxID=74035 RepID=UPI00144AF955|nr:uncharacterized protein GIQ15_03313 [Arthroderma uncinatum]KAF3483989.1 hypothetical protein GIQ15_03313 [Arthroderma uncinatum]